MFHILDMHSNPPKGYRVGTLPAVGTAAPDIKENSVLFCKMGMGVGSKSHVIVIVLFLLSSS